MVKLRPAVTPLYCLRYNFSAVVSGSRVKSLSEIAGLADLNEHPVFSPQNFDLVTLGDRVLQQQLIESFLRQCAATRETLISAAHAGKGPFDNAIHQLKGICHFTAAERVLHILRSVEATELLKDSGDRMQVVVILLEGLGELEKALLAVLSGLKSPTASASSSSGPRPGA